MIYFNLLLFVSSFIGISYNTPIGQGVVPTVIGCDVCGPQHQSPTGEWSSWGEWGPCQSYSGTYGQVRTRQCLGTGCVGGNDEARHCTPNNGGGCNTCGGTVGSWSSWSEWSLCEETSQGYVKTRKRICLSGTCQGNNQEVENCIQYNPPPTPEWENWSSWSQCSASCGGGTQTRTRVCDTKCGVCQCAGASQEIRQCNTQPCCTLGEWQEWSICSNQCGTGHRTRIRICSCTSCQGATIQQESCSLYINCPTTTTQPTCNQCQPPVIQPPLPCSTCGPLVNQPQPCSTCGPLVNQPPPSTCTTCGTSSNNNGGSITVGLIG
uniref:Uncharacterized protein n=1 Tax=Strongyloides stercoralis TaxID=6248 RepID=A0A0K0EIR1_STRER